MLHKFYVKYMKVYFVNIHRIFFGFDVIIYFEIHIDDIQKYYEMIFYLMYMNSYKFRLFWTYKY